MLERRPSTPSASLDSAFLNDTKNGPRARIVLAFRAIGCAEGSVRLFFRLTGSWRRGGRARLGGGTRLRGGLRRRPSRPLRRRLLLCLGRSDAIEALQAHENTAYKECDCQTVEQQVFTLSIHMMSANRIVAQPQRPLRCSCSNRSTLRRRRVQPMLGAVVSFEQCRNVFRPHN